MWDTALVDTKELNWAQHCGSPTQIHQSVLVEV